MQYLKMRFFIFVLVGCGMFGAFMAVATAINSNTIFYIVGAVYGYLILERLILKCPKCRKKPISLVKGLPDNCPHCGIEFPSLKNGLSIKGGTR